ncbi:hypothetical protein ID866_12426 [Astraeus odoratus]|nr:hypothetical protein ID866_12426 [Astraeus odoratus]
MASWHGNSTSPKPKPPKTLDMVNPSNAPARMGPATPSQPSKITYTSMPLPQMNTFSPGLTSKKCCPLSKRELTNQINKLAEQSNLPNLKGHSLCIGGTLEYLLQGVPFNIIQSQGCWAGHAFSLYLCKHATILAPYLQASLALEPFTQYTQPPIH